jgi:protein-S-isoprenylcysteine O-methyltransferase Ste14
MKYTLAALSIIIGAGSLVAFTVFLFTGSFHIVELSLDVTEILLFDTCLCLAFFGQHSGMIRKGIRNRVVQLIPRRYFGVLFSIASGIILFAFVFLWQESPSLIASVDGAYRWVLRGIFFLAVAGQIWISQALDAIDGFGTTALMKRSDAALPRNPILMVGPYGWVRHPGYFTMLLLIWSYPDLTADRLLLNVLFTAWIIVGAFLEERDLIAVYGEDYRAYQRAVPMLIPYRRSKKK